MKYYKISTPVEAIQWTGKNTQDVYDWVNKKHAIDLISWGCERVEKDSTDGWSCWEPGEAWISIKFKKKLISHAKEFIIDYKGAWVIWEFGFFYTLNDYYFKLNYVKDQKGSFNV